MRRASRKGGALLSVLWLTAALAAIALSVGALVRSEIDRATGAAEGMQAHFLARAGIERLLFQLEAMPLLAANASPQAVTMMMTPFGHIDRYDFPAGPVVVEIVSEAGKLNLNRTPPEQIEAVLLAMGVEPDRAASIAAAIHDWRGGGQVPSPDGQQALTQFDSIYLQRQPSFRAPHASFEEVEELLLVHGVTPEIYYGGFRTAPDGTFVPRPGLRDCFSPYIGFDSTVDLMSATAPVIASFGVPLPIAETFVAERQLADIMPPEPVGVLMQSIPPDLIRPRVGGLRPQAGRKIYTLRATARVSGTVRSVAVLIQLTPRPGVLYDVLRWEDQATAPANLFPEKTEAVVR